MHDTTFRRAVCLIATLSIIMRLGYLAFGDVLPVMWDARRYAAAGIALISFVDPSGSDPVTTERDDRYRFKHYYEKYIQGEQIEFLSYTPHSLTQAREEIFFSGPLYPMILSVVFFTSPVADFTVARVIGIAFDLLANLLLIGIGMRLVGRKAALIAGFVYALYFPFIMASTMLLLETSTNLLILLAIYLMIRGAETNRRLPMVLAGLATGGLVLNKPTAMLLMIPFLAGFYLYTRRSWSPSAFLGRSLSFLGPVAAVFFIWLIIASAHYGQLALRDPAYADANLRQSTSIINEGYDLDKVDDTFWKRSVAGEILDDPIGFAGLTLKKFDRLWRRPYNDFRKEFILPWQAGELLHLAVVVFGLFGLLLLLRTNLPAAGWPLMIIGYYTAVHLVFHSISRYNFQAMTMMMLTVGFAVATIRETYAARNSNRPVRLLIGLLLIILGGLFSPNWINALFETGLSAFVVIATLVLKTILLGAGIYILFYPLARHLRISRYAIPVATTAIIALITFSNTLAREQWAEYQTRLSSDRMKAGTRIYISSLSPLAPDDILVAAIDLNSAPGRRNTFSVTVADATAEYIGGEPPLKDYFYPKPTYRHYSRFIPIGLGEFRQYAMIPLPDSVIRPLIQQTGYLDISVAINNRFPEPNNSVSLWGRFDTGNLTTCIPSWRHSSIERFVHQNDPRIPYPVNYLSDSTVSYYIPRANEDIRSDGDLSSAPGLQTGRFNIFLMHFKPDGSVLIY